MSDELEEEPNYEISSFSQGLIEKMEQDGTMDMFQEELRNNPNYKILVRVVESGTSHRTGTVVRTLLWI